MTKIGFVVNGLCFGKLQFFKVISFNVSKKKKGERVVRFRVG